MTVIHIWLVSAPDPNQPHCVDCFQYHTRGRIHVCDTGSDPRWGWFGSGTEITIWHACCPAKYTHTLLSVLAYTYMYICMATPLNLTLSWGTGMQRAHTPCLAFLSLNGDTSVESGLRFHPPVRTYGLPSNVHVPYSRTLESTCTPQEEYYKCLVDHWPL